ncbi:MAG: hypothetical protein ACKOA9_06695, partial [Actinomycetota bacterium]
MRLALLAVVLLEAAALAAVWWWVPVPAPVDWGDPLGWLRRTDPDTATLVAGRLLAAGVAAWLLASTLLTVAAALARALPGRVHAVLGLGTRAAPAAVRHLVEAALAV